ncbi:MAG: amino acid ABC transporter substrate-binding protein [Hyphomicrobiales bacterium]
MKKALLPLALGVAMGVSATATFAASHGSSTLAEIQAKGFVQCGVSQGLPGFSNPDSSGAWSGLDVDVCRAIAAAIFGDGDAVKFTPLSAKERFTALQSGEIDILSRNTTWTMTRDASLGLNFSTVTYYDGQGFMVRSDMDIDSALKLSGASVCTNTGTTTELNVTDYFRANNMEFEIVAFEKADEVVAAYDAGRCEVYTTDASGLYAQRLKLEDPGAHIVLPEIISKEPLGPVVRQGDDGWLNLTKWVVYALVNAEELGVSSANIGDMMDSKNPAVARLMGNAGGYGEMIGLENDFAVKAIKAVGNYREIFERNVGPDTPLKIARGVNALWSDGGLMYAPPLR